MLPKNAITATVVAVLLALPAASATWYVHGTYEPDTADDANDGYMWTEPDTNENPAHRQVYFNAVQNVFQTGQNPNVGLAQTGIRNFPHQTFAAYLGVWKDCNDDGFIGMADGAIAEYRSELLLDAQICPDGGDFNKDGWVFEFLWIGPSDMTSNEGYFTHPRSINDTSARVWGDFGRPGVAAGGSCAVNPTPAGTTGSTGGVVSYVDCIARGSVTGTVDGADHDCSLGLCFDGEEPQRSDSLLNQRFPVHPFYDPYAPEGGQTGLIEDTASHGREKDEAVQVFDCDAEPTPVDDPTGQVPPSIEDPRGGDPFAIKDEDGNIAVLPALGDPTSVNTGGSLYDSVNSSEEALLDGCAGDDGNLAELGNLATAVEAYHGGVDADKGRRETDVYFYYNSAILATHALDDDDLLCFGDDFPPGCEGMIPINGTIQDGTPQDFGIGVHRFALGLGASWTGLPNYIRTPQSVDRGSLQPEGATYATFYAYVSEGGFGEGTYGAEACGTNRADSLNGWDCDPDHWWNPEYDPASTNPPTRPAAIEGGVRDMGARIGDAYNLRDIDCWDGGIMNGLAHASLALIASTCERPN